MDKKLSIDLVDLVLQHMFCSVGSGTKVGVVLTEVYHVLVGLVAHKLSIFNTNLVCSWYVPRLIACWMSVLTTRSGYSAVNVVQI